MNKFDERETPTDKPKFHVTQHPPDGDGQVLIEFRRLSGGGIPFSTTVHESQVEEAIQKYHEWVEKDEERQQEIVRRIHGDK
jgi:hypothetical protein